MRKDIKRNIIIGEDWIYLKFYTGIDNSEVLLLHNLYPQLNNFIKHKIIDKWFFIRYRDPHYHIRLRLHFVDRKHDYVIQILTRLINDMFKTKIIWNFQLDTYRREIERYGIDTILYAEDLFCYDSELIIEILLCLENQNYNIRGFISIILIDSYLNLFKTKLNEKFELLNEICLSNSKSKSLITKINNRYRENKNLINLFIKREEIQNYDTFEIYNLIDKKFILIEIVMKKILKKLHQNKQLEQKDLLRSIIHMTNNRLFKLNNNNNELIVFELLAKYYFSQKKIFDNSLGKTFQKIKGAKNEKTKNKNE